MTLLETVQVDPRDRRLLTAFLTVGLAVMALGGLFALLMKLVRTPAIEMLSTGVYYQSLTGHGILMFIFWLGFVQTAFLIVAGTILIRRPMWSYPVAWLGLGIMTLAAAAAFLGVLRGANITYHATIPLAGQFPAAWLIFASYVLLALGMGIVVFDVVATMLSAVPDKRSLDSWAAFFRDLPIASFAAFAGLFIAVPGLLAALRMFWAALLWSLGGGTIDADAYRMNWHIVFHIYHYVPALTLVGVAYVLVDVTADARSVYAKQIAKALFLLYPIFVPPTFIYHLLVDPNLSQTVKFVGTTLSLLVGVPTLLHMFIITGMLEARFHQPGDRPLAWLRRLPWSNPAFGSLAAGLGTLFFGGLIAYLLLQEQLAPMLHNTFVVPAYIHPIAAGGANLTYMGALYFGVPALLHRRLWGLRIARWQPYFMGGALIWMAAFGIAAGLAGVPRRYAAPGFAAPAEWTLWLNLSLGIGAMLAIVAGAMFLLVIGMTALVGERVATMEAAVADLVPTGLPEPTGIAWTPVALLPPIAFIVGIILLTMLAFNRLASMSLQMH